MEEFDIAVIGGGMVGASLALAGAAAGRRIVLIEGTAPDSSAHQSFDERTTALGNASRRILEALGVWDSVADQCGVIRAIHVSDADWSSGATLTTYEAADSARPAGYDLSFSVVLELKGPKAKVATKSNAVYVVTTHPKALVLRQETP